ncbi:MAG: hypothetical protein H6839_01665 [Planctomycetes bacterium]|nr:hypothetical protein [Planctomycetota bacterium]
MPPQYGGGAPYPVKRGPSKGVGVLKFLVGGCLTLGMIGALMNSGHEGIGAALFIGVVMGFGLRWMATGGANVLGKNIPLLPSLGIVVVGAIIGGAGGVPMSEAYWKAQEERVWEDLTVSKSAYMSAWEWDYDYFDKIPEKFQRAEAPGMKKYAEVQESIRLDNVVDLRRHISDIQTQHKDDANYDMALNAASAHLKTKYDTALAKLAKPGGVTLGDGEFPVDEKLRAAFKEILTDLSKSATADVYVAFTNSSDLTAPEGHEEVFNELLEDPSVKRGFPDGKVPVIDPGKAFSPAFDNARRGSFLKVSSDAFRNMFDANLLNLLPLENGVARDDKIVLEVSSKILRTITYFNYYNTDAAGTKTSNGLLFGIGVEWELKLYDRKGKLLFEKSTYSTPGSDIYISSQPNDPKWAVYSILMDSAYFNYSREVVGNFGLPPPEMQTTFAYNSYGVTGD